MNTTEITALLAVCSSFDSRKPNPETVQAWLAAIGDLEFTAARDAVVAHYQESREWIMPADIRGKVRRARRDRIDDDVIPMPRGLDPDDTAAYIRVIAAGRRALADGVTLDEPDGLTRRNLRELGPAPIATVSETDAEERAEYMDRLRSAQRSAAHELKAATRTPPPQVTAFCEEQTTVGDGIEICGAPATARRTSEGRAYPVCARHDQATADAKTLPADEMETAR